MTSRKQGRLCEERSSVYSQRESQLSRVTLAALREPPREAASSIWRWLVSPSTSQSRQHATSMHDLACSVFQLPHPCISISLYPSLGIYLLFLEHLEHLDSY